eukprot:tig00000806_g4369.t1
MSLNVYQCWTASNCTGSYKSVQAYGTILDGEDECKKLTGSEYANSIRQGWNGMCRTIDRSWDAYDDWQLDSDAQIVSANEAEMDMDAAELDIEAEAAAQMLEAEVLDA